MTDSRDKPELETLSYRDPKSLRRGFLGLNAQVIKSGMRVNSNPEPEQSTNTPEEAIDKLFPLTEQPKYDKCQYCGAGRVVRPSGEYQYACHCDEVENCSYNPPKCALPNEDGGVLANPEQRFKAPCKKNIGTEDKPDYRAIGQPNQNLMIISEIEGLMSQVNEKVDGLPAHTLRNQLHKEINDIQKTTLFGLRKAFE